MPRKAADPALKVIEGTFRKDRDARPDRPTPKRGVPQMPASLSAAAKREWKRLAALLDQMGVLTVVDQDVLMLTAEACARLKELSKAIAKHGTVYKTENVTGARVVKPRPEVQQYESTARRLQSLLGELGLTPAARSRVAKAAGVEQREDPWQKL